MQPSIAALALLLVPAAACRSGGGVVHRGAPGAIGPYSGAVLAGDFLFASGKIGSRRGGTFVEEAESTIDAVEAELAGWGLDLSDVVSVTVHLVDIGRYGAFNEVYARRFPAPFPARTCVAVAALPAGARVEVTALARRP